MPEIQLVPDASEMPEGLKKIGEAITAGVSFSFFAPFNSPSEVLGLAIGEPAMTLLLWTGGVVAAGLLFAACAIATLTLLAASLVLALTLQTDQALAMLGMAAVAALATAAVAVFTPIILLCLCQ